MGTTAQKLEYLGTTKSQLKDMINYGLDDNNKITSSTTFRNYVSSIFNAFLEALRNPDTLFTNLPKITGSGSNITLNDTANAPMRIELGATELTQDGTPTPSSPQDIHTISGSNKVKVCGINIWNELWESGYIDASGNLQSGNAIRTKDYVPVEPNTDYYIYNGTNNDGRWTFYDKNKQWLGTTTGVNASRTTLNNCYYLKYSTSINYGNTYLNNICINVSDTNINGHYYPYVSQEADIDLGVQNLLSDDFLYANGNTWIKNKDILNCWANSYTYGFAVYDIGKLSDYLGKTLTFSYEGEPNSMFKATSFIVCDNDGSNRTEIGNSIGQNSNVLTTTITGTYSQTRLAMRIYFENMVVGNSYKMEGVQVIEGSTYQKASYNPIQYGKIGNYEDKFIRTSGKNLFDISKYPIEVISSTRVGNNTSIPLKAGTYTISYNGGNELYYIVYDSNNTKISESNWESGNVVFTLANDYYVKFRIRKTGDATIIPSEITNIMLNEGTTALPYEPYGSNEWYIKKNIGKVVLDGSEAITLNNAGQTSQYYKVEITNKAFVDNNNTIPNLSSHYVSVRNAVGVFENEKFTISSSGDISICVTTINSVEDFKTWLSTNLPVFDYILATPTYTPITGTLANQLENVYQKMLSYSGQTNISQVNNDLPFEMSVSALESL